MGFGVGTYSLNLCCDFLKFFWTLEETHVVFDVKILHQNVACDVLPHLCKHQKNCVVLNMPKTCYVGQNICSFSNRHHKKHWSMGSSKVAMWLPPNHGKASMEDFSSIACP